MKYVPKQDEQLPAGFRWVRTNAGSALLAPSAVAEVMEREQHERAEAAEDERRKNLRAEQDAKVALAKQEQVPTAAKRWRRNAAVAKAKAGWHRVLPKLADLARDVQAEDDVGRSADKDVNQRRRRVVEKLLTLGPDRRVALPQDWRLALDELEAGLPNFRAPIRSIRNALALASATETAPRIPPQLLLGAPGLGKTYYSCERRSGSALFRR